MNVLRCTRKDVQEGALRLEATKVEVQESEYDEDFLKHLLPSLDWRLLREAATAVGISSLPESLNLENDPEFLKALHHILFDIHVIEGRLICQESGQIFPIEEGRPNMMLPEDLV